MPAQPGEQFSSPSSLPEPGISTQKLARKPQWDIQVATVGLTPLAPTIRVGHCLPVAVIAPPTTPLRRAPVVCPVAEDLAAADAPDNSPGVQ